MRRWSSFGTQSQAGIADSGATDAQTVPGLPSFLCTFSFLLLVVAAQQSDISLNYGLQEQRPPVARVGHAWSFQLLTDTFTGSADDITYDASGLPSWASFDADQLAFTGTPGQDDADSTTVTLTASSGSGSTSSTTSSSDDFVLLVSDEDAPTVEHSITQQLPNASSLEPECVLQWDGSLRIPPHEDFTIRFDLDTVVASDDSADIYYTCYAKDNTTLPDWLAFDNTTLSFKGTAPSTGVFDLTLFASDHYGYGDVQQHFTIRVDQHNFDLQQPLAALNATAGGPVNYTIPIDHLYIDHIQATDQNITVPKLDLSDFPGLNFTETDRLIFGTLPDSLNASSANVSIPVTLKSSYSQYIPTTIAINIVDGLFSASSLPDLELPYGKDFSKDLSDYLTDDNADYSASFSPSSSSSWLKFDAKKKMLTGTAPDMDSKDTRLIAQQTSDSDTTVDFSAYDPENGVEDAASLKVTLSDGAKQIHEHPSHGLSHGAIIAIAVVFGVLGGIALLALLAYCCILCLRRRKQRRHARDMQQQSPDSAAAISFDSQHSFTIVPLPFGKGKTLKTEKSFDHDAVLVDRPDPKSTAGADAHQSQQQPLEQSIRLSKEPSAPRRLTMLDPLGIAGLGISAQSQAGSVSSTHHNNNDNPTDNAHHTATFQSGYTQADATTWGSSHSSSIFYSDETHSNGHSSSNHTNSSSNHSTPQQRNDFRPFSSRATRHSRSSSATSWISAGIRYISGSKQTQDTPRVDVSPAPSALSGKPVTARSRLSPLNESPSRLQPRDGDHSPSGPLTPSLVPASPISVGNSPQLNSQPLLRAAEEEFDDAPESSPQKDRFSVASYEPDRSTEVAHSPIFFGTPPRSSTGTGGSIEGAGVEWTPNLDNGTIRPVERQGRAMGRKSSLSSRHSARTSASAAAAVEIGHMAVDVGTPFHFTPSLTPPPQLASPTRGGGGGRSTYTAVLWSPDEPERDGRLLPDWLHFAEQEIEFVRWALPLFLPCAVSHLLTSCSLHSGAFHPAKSMAAPLACKWWSTRTTGVALQPETDKRL